MTKVVNQHRNKDDVTWEEEEKSEKQRDWDEVDGVTQEAGFSCSLLDCCISAFAISVLTAHPASV